MKKFTINLYKGHPIINDGENIILIDTGAPKTIHATNRLSFYSKSYDCSTNYMGLTVSKISDMLGTNITTLLGTDILSDYKILFDYQNEVVEFNEQEIDIEGTQIGISTFMGIPIVELSIDNRNLKFFLDTGAKLSYLSANLTQNHESIGTDEDFYPGVGEFTTDCFEIPTSLGENSFVVKYGNLPNVLQMTLLMGGTDGIMGSDFFNTFKVMLDLQNKRLKYAN